MPDHECNDDGEDNLDELGSGAINIRVASISCSLVQVPEDEGVAYADRYQWQYVPQPKRSHSPQEPGTDNIHANLNFYREPNKIFLNIDKNYTKFFFISKYQD